MREERERERHTNKIDIEEKEKVRERFGTVLGLVLVRIRPKNTSWTLLCVTVAARLYPQLIPSPYNHHHRQPDFRDMS